MTQVSTERHGAATWKCEIDEVAGPLWYVRLSEANNPPYLVQKHVEAILDIADDGTLAGIELIDNMPLPPPALRASPADGELVERLRARLVDFDGEVADTLNAETERADLWDEVDIPVSDLRSIVVALSTQGKRLAELEGDRDTAEDTMFKAIARASAAEDALSTAEARALERAAKIADEFDCHLVEYRSDDEKDGYGSGVADAADGIAMALRSEVRALSTNEAGK